MTRHERISAGFLFAFMLSVQGLSQDEPRSTSDQVRETMQMSLARCFSEVHGMRRIEWVSPTSEDYAHMRALGDKAIPVLNLYLVQKQKDDFTQLMAVKFLIAVDSLKAIPSLKLAFAPDQWEMTRAQALSGLFRISEVDAAPLIKLGLNDPSQLVRERSEYLNRLSTARTESNKK